MMDFELEVCMKDFEACMLGFELKVYMKDL